jgi:hypothetical protein
MRRPSVKLVKTWDVAYDSELVQLATGDAEFSGDYWRLIDKVNRKTKYFYGETAWQDSRREASNLDFAAWGA